MPLLKKKPHCLSKPPEDLKPQELVYQIRFTKEIFRNYGEYLERMHLYQQRTWRCKATGKMNLTYEEAFLSEQRAAEKMQQFPKEFMGPVLKLVQFSTLRLDDLVNKILKTFKEHFVEGEHVVYVCDNLTKRCKVLQAIPCEDEEISGASYKIGWLGDDNSVTGMSVESGCSLVRKKAPFTRVLLKSFIRESVRNNATTRTAPWVVHESLCHKYNLTMMPPQELQKALGKQIGSVLDSNGLTSKRAAQESGDAETMAFTYKRQRKKNEAGAGDTVSYGDQEKPIKSLIVEGCLLKNHTPNPEEDSVAKVPSIHYPIEDSRVEPSQDDPPFQKRPIPSRDFLLPMDCIGRLMMVWNFCVLFGRAIQLYPFSLEEFEKALACESGDPVLLREIHHALVQSVMSDIGMEQLLGYKRKRKVKLSIQAWKDDLADVLELEDFKNLAGCASTIRQGSYSVLEPSVKLDILCELVNQSLVSPVIREQLDLYIEEKQAISAEKRKQAIEQSRMSKEVKDQLKQENLEKVDPDECHSDVGTDGEDASLEKDDVSPGASENRELDDDNTLASGSSCLKQKVASEQAEEKVNQNKRMNGEKEKHRFHAAVIRERKVQEQQLVQMQKRKEQLEREIEKRVIRTNPLGRDRDYNRYWFFPREGRIFVEDQELRRWGYYSAKEELEALHGSLNPKGIRERALKIQLEKQFTKLSDALQKRSREIAHKFIMEDASLRRSSRVKSSSYEASTSTVYKNKYRNP